MDTSGFYKKIGKDIVWAGNYVYAPGYTLTKTNHGNEEYPVDGWYYFASQDEAYLYFDGLTDDNGVPQQILVWQARAILLKYNLLHIVDNACSLDQLLKEEWEYRPTIRRNSVKTVEIAKSIGLTDELIDQLFIEASKLT